MGYSFDGVLGYAYYIPVADTVDLDARPDTAGTIYIKNSDPDLEQIQVEGGMRRMRKVMGRVLDGFTCPVRGRVFVTALIDSTGATHAAQVVRGIHPACDEKALVFIRALEFNPARYKDKPIAMPISLPVTYR